MLRSSATRLDNNGLFPKWLKRKESSWSLRSFKKMNRLNSMTSTVSLPLSVESTTTTPTTTSSSIMSTTSSSIIIPPTTTEEEEEEEKENEEPIEAPPSYNDKSHPWAPFQFPKSLSNRTIEPREEEGKEILPDYECTLQKMSYLKVKCENSKPGVKSKSRSWKYFYLQIYGTKIMAFVQNPYKIRSYRIAPAWSHSMYEAQVTTATDYLKERHVIRLQIANGPQYLIATQTEKEKNDWIMTMESSKNISSDLDERSMPQFITLISRRARRNRVNNPAAVINGGNRLLTADEQREAPLL